MKSPVGWLIVMAFLSAAAVPCGTSHAAIADHLFWGQIVQGRIFDDPAFETPLFLFQMELETSANVAFIEFFTPAGYSDFIPPDEFASSNGIETYHWVFDSTHVWEYWAYFIDPEPIAEFYGDGEYTIILHYIDGTQETTTVRYTVPGTTVPIAAPTQRPTLTWPPFDGVVGSPVVLEWNPVTDPHVRDIFLGVLGADNLYRVADFYEVDATQSIPYGLPEGVYDVELAFENFYGITNPDGVPFDLIKMTTLLHPFEVIFSAVYRFWSPVLDRHFYTISEQEKDFVVETYPHVWTFEGVAFYAGTTNYLENTAPVHRFWSNQSGSHFYTIVEAEKDWVIVNYSDIWVYEGVAFYAYPEGSQPEIASPVFRFWRPSDGSHFYTIDEAEANFVIAQYGHIFVFEGIAYYAFD
jgi:hypothetical protein